MTTAKLSSDQRKEIAKNAAKARWIPKATHEGILKIMGKDLPCVVLEDGRRIINQTSVFRAFDRPQRGVRSSEVRELSIPSFLDAKNLRNYLTDEVKDQITLITYFNLNGTETKGYSAETIPKVCEIYLSAKKDNKLTHGQIKIADLSEVLIKILSRIGIIGLIDEATGYQEIRPRHALEAYLNKILSKELAAWCKRFPDIYYENIYLIRGWPKFSTSKNKYSCVGHYTNDIVYSRIGEDVLKELKEKSPDTSKTKLHQWLSVDTGHPLLSKHLHEIITLQKLAIAQGFGWKRFMDMVDLILPKKLNALPQIEEQNPI